LLPAAVLLLHASGRCLFPASYTPTVLTLLLLLLLLLILTL
jgi:hypothetical protein